MYYVIALQRTYKILWNSFNSMNNNYIKITTEKWASLPIFYYMKIDN